MQLSPCSFREVVSGREEIRCRLVQQLLGLPTTDGCQIEVTACRACSRFGLPHPGLPNPVVSSFVYSLAKEIRQNGGQRDCDVGQSWQVECYALTSLAEEPNELSKPPLSSLSPERRNRCRAVAAFTPFRRNSTSIGLIGSGTATGLGHINRDLAEHRAIDNWLMVDDANFASLNLTDSKMRATRVSCDVEEKVVRRWLKSVDWVIWAESNPLKFLPELARNINKRVACIPMWEWTSPTDTWLRCVDLLICPTRHAYHMFIDWKQRFGFEWRVAYFPWPISTARFRFRRREKCRRFVFINGHGGARARDFDTDRQLGPRKGCDIVLAAASLTPDIPWRVYTQVDLATTTTRNVEVLEGPVDHALLYAEGDVCVQPSRWEGLGLPLLECQAAGMPLVTVDAAPMNEYRPLRCVAPSDWEWGYVCWGQPMRIPIVSPESLAKIVRQLHGSDIGAASDGAHDWISRERTWDFALQRWRELFEEDQ